MAAVFPDGKEKKWSIVSSTTAFKLRGAIGGEKDCGITSLAALDSLLLISLGESGLDGPAWALSLPGAGVWGRIHQPDKKHGGRRLIQGELQAL